MCSVCLDAEGKVMASPIGMTYGGSGGTIQPCMVIACSLLLEASQHALTESLLDD